ncbi:hypothetical protein HID58_029748 [Brassica napus]|uniref:Uncharacterized protein n=1 Tax=Brassica napus TaxID=3708 RepID=A0ABQ8CDZ2_BRANA|nr:hypothetical protein HID58_029748 [Brassica napus]
MIESAYNCQNQAVVSVTFRFEAPQTTLRQVKAVEDVHRRLCFLSYPKGARLYASEGPKDYNLLGNETTFLKSTLILVHIFLYTLIVSMSTAYTYFS